MDRLAEMLSGAVTRLGGTEEERKNEKRDGSVRARASRGAGIEQSHHPSAFGEAGLGEEGSADVAHVVC
jgi:hypothetical protein